MAEIDFSWDQLYASAASTPGKDSGASLRNMVLTRNKRWFIKLRWAAIAVLSVVLVATNLFKDVLGRTGISAPSLWNFWIVAALIAANLFLGRRKALRFLTPTRNLWIQIIVDLICLTSVVHFSGSTGSPAPFLYALHVALACVFFGRTSSLLVTTIAAVLYNFCVAAEYGGLTRPRVIFPSHGLESGVFLHSVAVTGFIFLLWYVVSRLSKVVMINEAMLLKASKSAKAAQQERARLALQMTHQLKSPLDAVESFSRLIEVEIGSALTPKAKRLLRKIQVKLSSMRDLVLDVLQLSNLDPQANTTTMGASDIGRLLHKCVHDMQGKGDQRGIKIKHEIEDITVDCFSAQMQVLFANLLSNAINYSHDNGTVRVKLGLEGQRCEPTLRVSDEGIGIDPDKLPHIFEPYFRTKEAARHNPHSTGVGLALVSRIAQTHNIRISVQSEIGKGTTFVLAFQGTDQVVAGSEDQCNVAEDGNVSGATAPPQSTEQCPPADSAAGTRKRAHL